MSSATELIERPTKFQTGTGLAIHNNYVVNVLLGKVKRGYFERRVIPYCSNISETTQASELNVGGYNLP